mgnify:CR=1 FL=1
MILSIFLSPFSLNLVLVSVLQGMCLICFLIYPIFFNGILANLAVIMLQILTVSTEFIVLATYLFSSG